MVAADYKANSRRSLIESNTPRITSVPPFRVDGKALDVTTDRVSAYAAHRLKEGAAQAATVNYEMAVLRRAFRLGVRAGKVGLRPEISMLHVDNARKGFFEPAQYRAVFS
jgi:hypothetical protein